MMEHDETENVSTQARCLQLHADDNVAVALEDITRGQIAVIGTAPSVPHVANEAIARGHKVALRPIKTGDVVLKYGVAIGFAMAPIASGDWVHTHNCRSGIDERSHTLNRHTGAPTDTQYA
jgi:hypothetical protein